MVATKTTKQLSAGVGFGFGFRFRNIAQKNTLHSIRAQNDYTYTPRRLTIFLRKIALSTLVRICSPEESPTYILHEGRSY